ncbi:DEAD/DEAH box helicase [Chloroflexota bacterium]
MTRVFLLEQAFESVKGKMNLRLPQLECLKRLHPVLRDLPKTLAECSQQECIDVFRGHYPRWSYGGVCPEMTCELATGVGKTRLMGAIMAYLYKSHESKHFLILAPRVPILEKLVRESNSGHRKYLFVDPSYIPQPIVCHAGNFESYNPKQLQLEPSLQLWIISPQAIARTKGEESLRFRRYSEYLGMSPFDYLKGLDDLVVFFDESHHLGSERDDNISAWMQSVRDLRPKLLFEMSASPRPSANILYRYPLNQCLNEGLYTKAVQAIVKERPEGMDDANWDRATLRFAIDRLAVKRASLIEARKHEFRKEQPNPVMLVCAADIHHAEEVTWWLRDQLGEEGAVLLVHSGLPEEKYLGSLLEVEKADSKVRVIVNVFQLTEGWDVTNVYVIVPLRALATVTGVLQTMGRGLRLPFSRRIDDYEVDTLDVLCFGKQSLNEIIELVIKQGFGSPEDGRSYIDVKGEGEVETDVPDTKPYAMVARQSLHLEIPRIDLEQPQLDPTCLYVPPARAREAAAIELSDPNTIRSIRGRMGFERQTFVSTVTSMVLRRRTSLGGITDYKAISECVEKLISDAGVGKDDPIRMEPEVVTLHIIEAVDRLLDSSIPTYKLADGNIVLEARSFDIQVPVTFDSPIPCTRLDF